MQLKHLDEITTDHRHIFLAPHFDDAVYSCGGTLAVQASVGLRPLVITVCAGVPDHAILSSFAMDVHRRMGFSQDVKTAIQARRQEDAAAMEMLGVDYLWLDYSDAIYRGIPAYYPRESMLIGGEVHAGDRWIDEELAQLLVGLRQRLPDTVWYAPLGVGRHVDHQIVCSAADRLTRLGARVNLYEDFPYVAQRQDALAARLEELGNDMEPGLVEMSEMLHLRQNASAQYASQTAVHFGEQGALFQAIESYTHSIRPVATVHLERYWMAR